MLHAELKQSRHTLIKPVGIQHGSVGAVLPIGLARPPARPSRMLPAGASGWAGWARARRATIGTAGNAQAISERDLRNAAVP